MKHTKYFSQFSFFLFFIFIGMEVLSQTDKNRTGNLQKNSNRVIEGGKDQLIQLYEIAASQVYKIDDHELSPDSILTVAAILYKDGTTNGDEFNVVRAKILSSWYYFENWKVDTARTLINENLTFFKKHSAFSQHIDHGRSLYNSAKISIRSRELHLAKSYAQDALEIFELGGHQMYISNSLVILGAIDFMVSDYPEALDNYMRALNIKKDLGIPKEMQSTDLYNISLVLNRMGEYKKQLTYAFELLRIAEEKHDTNSQMLVLNSLGNVYSEKLNNPDSALYYYERCKEIALANNNINRYYLAEINILNMYSSIENYEISNELAKSIINGGEEVPEWVKEEAITIIAQNYLLIGDINNSIKMGTASFRFAKARGSKEEIINRSEILWKAYQRSGKYDSAFQYLKIMYTYKDSLFNDENQRKLSSLYAELETIEKQKEIDELQREKELQESRTLNLTIILISGGIISILIIFSGILAYRNKVKRHKLMKFELQTEIERKIHDLNQQSVRMIQKSNSLAELEEDLKKMKGGLVNGEAQTVQNMLNTIRVSKIVDKEWDKFDEYFGSLNQQFLDRLGERLPELTVNEKRLAALIKMGFTNREIAELMNIEYKSVSMAKYRMKKKLFLSEDGNLYKFLVDMEKGGS